jgi:hypothetical protein
MGGVAVVRKPFGKGGQSAWWVLDGEELIGPFPARRDADLAALRLCQTGRA